jgi:hypothetical protein
MLRLWQGGLVWRVPTISRFCLVEADQNLSRSDLKTQPGVSIPGKDQEAGRPHQALRSRPRRRPRILAGGVLECWSKGVLRFVGIAPRVREVGDAEGAVDIRSEFGSSTKSSLTRFCLPFGAWSFSIDKPGSKLWAQPLNPFETKATRAMFITCFRRVISVVAVLFAANCFAEGTTQPQDEMSGRVRREVLDQLNPVRVNVSTKGITTLEFPSGIQAIDGDGFQAENEQTNSQSAAANAQFSISTGDNWISVKALREGVEQNLNVILNGRVYPIVLTWTDDHDYAVLFSLKNGPLGPGVAGRSSRNRKEISAGRLLGLLDKIRGYPTFSQVQPAMYIGIDVSEPSAQHKGIDETEHLHSEIKRVIRDNGLDALAFEVEITNKTDQIIYYDPEGFAVRAGQEVYQQIVSDAPGKIAAKTTQTAFFVIAGSAESTHPNDLSVYNDFALLIREVKGNK